jgi:hypothetical protein
MSAKVTLGYGMTVNVGDYTNVRPEMRVEMDVPPGEHVQDFIEEQMDLLISAVHAIADDELEAHGRTARYCGDTLYEVRRNDDRQCIIALPSGFDLPEESSWKTRDRWHGVSHYTGRDYPGRMRRHTAAELLEVVRTHYPDYAVVFSTMGDLSDLPPLPDPGPEPMWHKKNLEDYLGRRYLNIPEDDWDAVGALDYVDKDYLSRVYELTRSSWNSPAQLDKADALFFILENRPFPAEPEQEPEEEDYDDDYGDDYDDD